MLLNTSTRRGSGILEATSVLIEESRMPEQHGRRLIEGKSQHLIYNAACTWRHIGSFPVISSFTCNLFAIHVTSCSVERLWSRMRALYKRTSSGCKMHLTYVDLEFLPEEFVDLVERDDQDLGMDTSKDSRKRDSHA